MINVAFPADGEAMPRHRVEAAIEYLINYLDSIDQDPDLEPYLAGAIATDLEMDDADLEEEPNEDWHQPLRLVAAGVIR